MQCSHALAAGMGGMRAAGDLVARMQMTRGMRLEPAKRHVAERLGVAPEELSDPVVMNEVRRDRGLGRIPVQDATYPREPTGHGGEVQRSPRCWACRSTPSSAPSLGSGSRTTEALYPSACLLHGSPVAGVGSAPRWRLGGAPK